MINAKEEFIQHIQYKNLKVKSAVLVHKVSYGNKINYILKEKYTPSEYENFLNSIDFEYDDGFGRQEIKGCILYEDGTWSDRYEYDGSEWWAYQKCPTIEYFIEDK